MSISLQLSSIVFILAFCLGGCETVQVDSSSSGSKVLSSSSKCYVSPDFADTDGSRPPSERTDENVRKIVGSTLEAKGYTVVDSASAADFTINGSWEKGKVLGSKQPSGAIGGSNQANAGNAFYLTLTAMKNGASLWSVTSPLVGGKLSDEIPVLLKDFPSQGDS
ncbi:hypothetical protein [Cerasicoccus arenae]|uniref:Uncharacterized protein n=1 Tax=Cerasicoccus arenae TaxID=424488 RepID=A0A8J3DDL2_9BACT|nr:hypothetical protein [Cerasicoccus arenae]MBK1857418.1 hypothetical protein [Cerasicoccus arenae]GHC07838.1 hypothetical protein GCM10007047_26300 [Cerasicoccus arenae]